MPDAGYKIRLQRKYLRLMYSLLKSKSFGADPAKCSREYQERMQCTEAEPAQKTVEPFNEEQDDRSYSA
jgi:hypothetical protein